MSEGTDRPRYPDPGDPEDSDGLQLERTALAWRRTGLALWVAALLLARLTFTTGGPLGVVLVLAAAAVATWAVVASRRRERLDRGALREGRLRDGRLPAAMSLVAVLLAAAELVVVLRPR